MIKQIEELRKEINKIDAFILDKILERLKIVKSIHKIKQVSSELIVDINREKQIISTLTSQISDKSTQILIERIYDIIFQEVKGLSYSTNPLVLSKINELVSKNQFFIAGPCSVESEIQINDLAQKISEIGIKFLRGGIFKARTNPSSFQGLREKGLQMFYDAAKNNNLFTVSEFLDIEQTKSYFEYFDVIMVGSRNMTNFEFLSKLGKLTAKIQKPIILKRGFASTIDEFLAASDYIIREGNPNVILCLRGIRSFEDATGFFRFPPDLHSIVELKAKTDLPVIFDPSHSAGRTEIVPQLAIASKNLGFNGVIIEVHNDAKNALSDGNQAINTDTLAEVFKVFNENPIT